MENINKVELCGFVGTVYSQKGEGAELIRFTLATSLNYVGKDGNQVIETTWHTITAFKNKVDIDLSRIQKGCGVYLLGRIRNYRYVAADGTEKYASDILATEVVIKIESKHQDLPEVDDQ